MGSEFRIKVPARTELAKKVFQNFKKEINDTFCTSVVEMMLIKTSCPYCYDDRRQGVEIDPEGHIVTSCCHKKIFVANSAAEKKLKDIIYIESFADTSTSMSSCCRFKKSDDKKEEPRVVGYSLSNTKTIANKSIEGWPAGDYTSACIDKPIYADTCNTSVGSMKVSTINENKKGGKNMKNIMSNLKFGPVDSYMFRVSPFGIAFKSKDGYAVYDKEKEEVVDVTNFCFDVNNMIYRMPVSIKNIAANDIIVHNAVPMIVLKIKEKDIEVLDVTAAEKKTILPVTNIFGFNYYTKITSLMDFSNLSIDKDNPFEKMLPFMMMSGNNGDMNPMMMMMLMGDGDFGMSKEMMMMMAMSGGNMDMNSMMPLLLMKNLK